MNRGIAAVLLALFVGLTVDPSWFMVRTAACAQLLGELSSQDKLLQEATKRGLIPKDHLELFQEASASGLLKTEPSNLDKSGYLPASRQRSDLFKSRRWWCGPFGLYYQEENETVRYECFRRECDEGNDQGMDRRFFPKGCVYPVSRATNTTDCALAETWLLTNPDEGAVFPFASGSLYWNKIKLSKIFSLTCATVCGHFYVGRSGCTIPGAERHPNGQGIEEVYRVDYLAKDEDPDRHRHRTRRSKPRGSASQLGLMKLSRKCPRDLPRTSPGSSSRKGQVAST